MKKFIFLVTTIIFFALFSINKIEAKELNSTLGYNWESGIDILYGMDEDELDEQNFISNVKMIDELKIYQEGYITLTLEIRGQAFSLYIISKLTFENTKLTNINMSMSNEEFYNINIRTSGYEITLSKPALIRAYYNESASTQETEGRMNSDKVIFMPNKSDTDYINNDKLFNKVTTKIIKYQSDDEEINLEDIKISKDQAPDINYLFDNIDKSIYIFDTNYYPKNNKINEGSYKTTIYIKEDNKYKKSTFNIISVDDNINYLLSITLADNDIIDRNFVLNSLNLDDAVNIINLNLDNYINNNYNDGYDVYLLVEKNNIYYLLKTKIITKNGTPISTSIDDSPELDKIKDVINTGYKNILNKEDLIEEIKTDLDLDFESIDISSDYFKNKDKVASYEAYVEINLKNGTSLNKNIIINVTDDVAPVIISYNIITSTNNVINFGEIQNRLYAVDEIDGEISCKNIELIDLNSYLSNTDKVGTYRIKARVSDLSGNIAISTFEIIVKDENILSSYIENKTICITNSYVVDEKAIKSFLRKNGLISSDKIKIESSYFDSEEKDGEYQLVLNSDSVTDTYTLKVYDGTLKNNTVIENSTKTNKIIYYIIFGIIAFLILFILFLVAKTIKKRKHK